MVSVEEATKVSPDEEISRPITAKKDGIERVQKDRVANAVREMRGRAPVLRGNGIFKHPSDWTEEEMNFIVDCLKQNIPVYTIASLVHCERHTLTKLINSVPELRQLKEYKYENMLDEAEYQLDQQNKKGNASTLIFTLQTMGRKRGWTTEDVSNENENEEGSSRIVMGIIPDDEVSKAEAFVESKKEDREKKNTVLPDPLAMAMTEAAVKEEVARQVEATKPEVIDVEDASVSSPPYADNGGMPPDYGHMPNGGYPQSDDPWASGGDSMFFQ